MDGLTFILGFFSFWLGACIASFLNVVIWRVPRGESIVSPPSHCPKCNTLIKWYHNLPIVAWLALGGKCAKCREPISPRYIIIETIGGILFLAVYIAYLMPFVEVVDRQLVIPIHETISLSVMWVWVSLMIVGTMIDYDHQLLPDFVTVGGMVLGLLYKGSFVVLNLIDGPNCLKAYNPLIDSVIGLVFGFGLLWLVRFIGTKVFKREAMGMGDVFLMGAVGALFGPVAVVGVLMISSILGSIAGLVLVSLSKAKFGKFVAIPYGPYICMACLVWMFWGVPISKWYLKLLGF